MTMHIHRRAALRRGFAAIAALAASLSAWAADPPDDPRVALVIGNSAYANGPLLNPSNDAKAIGDALRLMGFSVVEVHDAAKAQMVEAIADATELLKGKHGVGMLYFAGHGVQLDWHNYMLPVDAAIARPDDVRAQGIDVQAVIDAFRAAGNRVNILVLDACRDNPFEASASAKGLAPMDAPSGTFLAFATAPGNVAEDSDSGSANGLYTGFLLREMTRPKARIEDVFKRVRLQVRERSESRQVPWESTSLEEAFTFDGRVREAPKESAGQINEDFELERGDWAAIVDSKDPADFYDFLERYPHGFLSEKAEFRLDQLQHPNLAPEPAPDGIARLASGVPRYATGDTFTWETTDGYSGAKRRRVEAVVAADDRRVLFTNGNVFDQMGGIVEQNGRVFEPPILQSPADLVVGKKWRTAFTTTSPQGVVTQTYLDYKVVALEEIRTAAGPFKAFRVEGSGESSVPGRYGVQVLHSTEWIDPATMLQVRHEWQARNGSLIADWWTVELEAVKRVPR